MEDLDDGSDSQPSCDNMDQHEMKQIFQEALSEEDMQECFGQDDALATDAKQKNLNVVLEESTEITE